MDPDFNEDQHSSEDERIPLDEQDPPLPLHRYLNLCDKGLHWVPCEYDEEWKSPLYEPGCGLCRLSDEIKRITSLSSGVYWKDLSGRDWEGLRESVDLNEMDWEALREVLSRSSGPEAS